MIRTTHSRHSTGFSLIEVLIAVVILSFGLLALAALQGSLFKSSAESKAQSVALGLASEKLEYFRGYLDTSAYQAINSGTDTPPALGGVTYARSWTVTRYAYPNAGGNFALIATNTGATPSGYVSNNEFKQVQVNVTWTDAQNVAQRVVLQEAIAAIDPGDSRKIGKLALGATPRGPEVKIYTPSSQQEGVIPIAIGAGSDDTATAATNPKPLVNGSNVIETRFDVLTYSGVSGNTATARARVETSIVGCTCNSATAPTGGGKRPTYWDGSRYTLPEDATAVLGAGYVPLAGADASPPAPQSAVCTLCCRDHHDPASLPSSAAKFDPLNSSHSSGHFLLNGSTAALTGPFTSGRYTEACRVLRVGGLFRVAADSYDDYMNVLNTKSLGLDVTSADSLKSEYVPTTTATGHYQDFVKAYLNARVVTPTSGYNNRPTGIAGIESANSINTQTAVNLPVGATDKWLHLRGLYIDYLEDAARQAITDAKTGCLGAGGGVPTSAELQACVFRVLPFTSINLTELGNYTPAVVGDAGLTQIVVAGNNYSFFSTLTNVQPVRGKVTRGSAPTTGTTTNALATQRRSNSGLSTLIGGIDTEDASTSAPSTWTATQPFTIQGTGGGGGGTFTVTLNGYPFASNTKKPFITDVPSATCTPLASGNPYSCTSSSLGVSQILTVGPQFNFTSPLTAGSQTLQCHTAAAPAVFFSHTFGANGQGVQTINVCKNYKVASSTLAGAVGLPLPSDGVQGEYTSIDYPAINSGDAITLTITPQVDTTSYDCVGPSSGAGDNQFVVTAKVCP